MTRNYHKTALGVYKEGGVFNDRISYQNHKEYTSLRFTTNNWWAVILNLFKNHNVHGHECTCNAHVTGIYHFTILTISINWFAGIDENFTILR